MGNPPEETDMTPKKLRQLWFLVETTHTNLLLKLDDTSLIQWLVQQIDDQCLLEHQETEVLSAYIRSRLSLIRDLAQARQLGRSKIIC